MAFTTAQAGGQIQPTANVPAAYQGDALELARAQRLAQMLGSQPMPEGQMVSGRFVAPSWTQQLAGLVNAGTGAYFANKAENQQQELAKKLREGEATAMADYVEQRKTNPELANTNLYMNPVASAAQKDLAFKRMTEGPMKLGAEETLVDPFSYKPVATGAEKTAPDVRTAAQMLGIRGTPDTWNPQQTAAVNTQIMAMKRAGATSINMPSGEERKAGFMSSILDRNILQMQNALGVDPKAIKPNVPASIVEAITGPNLLSRGMKPEQRQIVEDSQLDVLDAALTLRTGAAYTKEQLNAMRDTYFPVLNDKPPAIAAKKQRLETLLEGAYIAAGRATPPRVSAPPPPPAPNNSIAGNAQQTNLPKISGPKFIGFETPFTGNQ
jgi:hypothetical protein